ncbi:MAG TPA: hypothetical protein VK765_03995 [Solirubrobacteraceae bacterium]|nr:hypothetical protein [Solirubrobacteraceae bacterium]
MLLIGGAWPLLVELTPAANRPWISSTADNAVLSLIFGYNGLGRIEGQSGGPQALGGSNLFGGSTGPLRLFNEALGGQAGWLLGFALISGVAVLLACRLRRTDPRSAWLLVVGGALLTTAAVFSFAHGIFHPTELRWLTPTLLVLGALAVTLLLVGAPRLRLAALTGALALLLAPATWAVQTLGHATSGTFPAGGPASNPASEFGGRPGALGGAHGTFPGARPGFAGGPPGAAAPGNPGQAGPTAGRPPLFGNGTSSTRSPSRAEPGAAAAGGPVAAAAAGLGDTRGDARPTGRLATPGAGFGSSLAPGVAGHSGAGIFGATSQSLTAAVRYANTHGGGTVAVASQSEAASLVIDGEHVAGIGGFSGRESETNAVWLAQEVRTRHIRWVLTTSGAPGGGPSGGPAGRDQRVGSTRAMAAVTASCKRVSVLSGLYDCAGRATRLAAAATKQDGSADATRSR